jgi:hypothetical protein
MMEMVIFVVKEKPKIIQSFTSQIKTIQYKEINIAKKSMR